jgi:arylsulfatase A-like enzyme
VKAGSRRRELVICQDIAPTLIALAGGKPGRRSRDGRCCRCSPASAPVAQVVPRRVLGRAGDAVARRHDVQGGAHRPHKYIHWVNRGRDGELDELYDLDRDPYELRISTAAARTHRCARS